MLGVDDYIGRRTHSRAPLYLSYGSDLANRVFLESVERGESVRNQDEAGGYSMIQEILPEAVGCCLS